MAREIQSQVSLSLGQTENNELPHYETAPIKLPFSSEDPSIDHRVTEPLWI